MAREVCETCAHVSLRWIESVVRLFPDFGGSTLARPPVDLESYRLDPVDEVGHGHRRCRLCSQVAVYEIPQGLMCDEHAWQAAARLDWEVNDPWVPIRIDASQA